MGAARIERGERARSGGRARVLGVTSSGSASRELCLVGDSGPMRELRRQVRAVARASSTVLLTGETGTGKGLVARAIQGLSERCDRPFVHVDCAALSPSVIESELFGHERGAFTGAQARRAGRFELAASGTIFLDEIGDIEPLLQAKLLRVLQDREFERVGGSRTLRMGARIVAATNRDLAAEREAGRFRSDLYYRLQVCEIGVPPLRERPDDLPLLLAHWIELLSERPVGPRISRDFHEGLRAHPWPGNVRELRNLVERLLVSWPRSVWDRALLERTLGAASRADAGAPRPAAASRADFDDQERARLSNALARHRWNVSAAARSLGLSRGALRGRMVRLGLGS